ncbi:MAG: phosphatase PAP2 family protein, partial [Bacteroidota bacterium]
LGISVVYFLYLDHGDFVLWWSNQRNSFLTFFFKYWTYTGDWFFVVTVTLALIFFRLRYGLILALVSIVQGLTTALFKQVLFVGTPRPKGYFAGKQVLDLIEGVKVQSLNSFPSGHTMTAFALATFIALMMQNKKYSIFLLLGAILTALSRVYLGHHFLIDIIAGSLIGMLIATIIYMIFEKYLNQDNRLEEDQPDQDLLKMDLNVDDVNEPGL